MHNLPRARWRDPWNEIIFGHQTFGGRLFDVILLVLILLSVLILESVSRMRQNYGPVLRIAEWIFTGLFTLEYVAPLATATSARRDARSFFGIIDFSRGRSCLLLLSGGGHPVI